MRSGGCGGTCRRTARRGTPGEKKGHKKVSMTAYQNLLTRLPREPRTWLVTGCAGFIDRLTPQPLAATLMIFVQKAADPT